MSNRYNPAQKEAIEFGDGPLLVVAGAGTGKTRVIVERIARLIDSGVEKNQILALTFTEKAAQEMRDRVGLLLKHSYGVEIPIYTFNGFGQEMLREFATEIGRSTSLRLIGDSGKIVMLREHLDSLGLEYYAPVSAPDAQLAAIANYISKLKQHLVKPDQYSQLVETMPETDEADRLEKKRHTELSHAFKMYVEISRQKNSIDYDDQIYLLVELLEDRANILKRLQERYRYILVDEFQDTNPMQSRLLDLLTSAHQNIMVVGDDDQSIYGWRGATLANILEFKKRYPQTHEVTLNENFRSTQEILDAAYRMIQHNNPNRLEVINQLDKKLIASRGQGIEPVVCSFATLDSELSWIVEDIKTRIANGVEPGSIAVLARRNATIRQLHSLMDTYGVEHVVTGISSDMYRQPIVATMIEALKTVVDPLDSQALYHTLTSALFKHDAVALAVLAAQARRTHQTLEDVLKQSETQEFRNTLRLIEGWRASLHEAPVGTMAYSIITDSGLKLELYEQAALDEQQAFRVQTLGKWFATLRDFSAVVDVPNTISYLQNLDALKAEGELVSEDTPDGFGLLPTVSTIHRAKGLEWGIVYIADCTEGSFPLKKQSDAMVVPPKLSHASAADDHYEEERRLMYVAVTRARDSLIMTYADTHNGTSPRRRSRFLDELFGDQTAQRIADNVLQTSLELFQEVATQHHTIPPHMLHGNDIVLTSSQICDYLRCPIDFKYRHILQVPLPYDPTREVGTLLHGLIQKLQEAKKSHTDIPPLDDLLGTLKDSWPQEGYLSAHQRSRARSTAETSFTEFYRRIQHEPIPYAIEFPFRVRIPKSNLIMTGRIDIVYQTEEGVEIRDYKTSTNASTADKAKKSAQTSKQLELYALAWLLTYDEMPVRVSLDFIQTGHIGSVKKQQKTLDSLRTKLENVSAAIRTGSFSPGHDHRYCIHPTLSDS